MKKILKENFDMTTNPLKTQRLRILTNLRRLKVFIEPSKTKELKTRRLRILTNLRRFKVFIKPLKTKDERTLED